ncbi:MAG: proline dehydrogenase family protein [Bacteroidetes bacterium]|nr:proline dehydrogenase family protein [Bacteroidota bacterium]MCY4205109.1 proline dehydrogenase family protein [Bacteroidota bacterium]
MIRLPFVLARGFVAAESLRDTIPVVKRLTDKGLFTTIDLLGEHVASRDLALRSRDAYIKLLHALASDSDLDRNISIKLSMIGQIIDEDFCLENLRLLLDEAQSLGAFIRLDMEGSSILDSTLRIFESVFPDYPEHVGPVLQAYLKRTLKDVTRMCDLGARVRLCKGAYREPDQIALQRMSDIRTQFITCMHKLLEYGNYPAIATHDDILIQATKSFARRKGINPSKFEFQMLYGLRPQTQEATVCEGYNMRVYVPYGRMWLPYYIRRLRERPENIAFLLRNILRS